MDINNFDTATAEKKVPVWVLCAAATVFIMYISLFPLIPLADLFGFAALLLFSCVYSLILTKKSGFAAAIPIVAALSAITAPALAGEGFGVAVCLRYANLLFALLIAVCIYWCTKNKVAKSVTFAAVSAVGSVYIFVTLLFIVWDIYGNINPEAVQNAVSSVTDYFGEIYGILLETALGGGEDAEVRRTVKQLAESMALSVKASIPSSVVIYAMVFSAACVLIYGFIARISGMKCECFDGRLWVFSMSKVSSVVFELVYLAYIFVMLFSDSLVLNSALMNIISVLTVPFAYIGIRYFHSMLSKNVGSKVMSAVIEAAVLFFLMMLTGGTMIFTFIAFVGSSIEFRKNYRSNL